MWCLWRFRSSIRLRPLGPSWAEAWQCHGRVVDLCSSSFIVATVAMVSHVAARGALQHGQHAAWTCCMLLRPRRSNLKSAEFQGNWHFRVNCFYWLIAWLLGVSLLSFMSAWNGFAPGSMRSSEHWWWQRAKCRARFLGFGELSSNQLLLFFFNYQWHQNDIPLALDVVGIFMIFYVLWLLWNTKLGRFVPILQPAGILRSKCKARCHQISTALCNI